MTLDDWLQHKRRNETLLWVAFFVLQTAANIAVVWIDLDQLDRDFAFWEVATWEASSALVMLLLIPVMLAFDRRFPLQRGRLSTSVPAHFLFTVAWSALHVAGMVAVREAVYAAFGNDYDFGPVAQGFFYELLKDFRSYFALLALVYLYRFVVRRMRGEASFVPEGERESSPAVPDRFLVKMLGKEFLVRVDDIDWIEAAGNYVSLHVGDKCYMLRETMAAIEKRLAERGFARVHRSAIVNLDRVDFLEPFDTGDARAHLVSGRAVPVSRSYRQQLKEKLA